MSYLLEKHKIEVPDELEKPTDEDSLKKGKKKGFTSKSSYCSKGFHSEKKCFKKKMGIIYYLLEKHKIEVPYELEKVVDSLEQCHSAHFQGDITYSLSAKVKSISHVSYIYLVFDI